MTDRIKRELPLKDVDEEITALFQQWLVAFENIARDDEESAAALARIEFEHRSDTGRRTAWGCGEAWAASLPE